MRFFFVAVLVVAAFVWCGVGVVSRQHQAVALGYDIAEATREQGRLEEELRRLEIDRAALLSTRRLEPLAIRAGLRVPYGDQVVRVGLPDGEVGDAR